MQTSPSAPSGTASPEPGRSSLICWPGSTVPTLPMRRAAGGFMVDVQVASDRP